MNEIQKKFKEFKELKKPDGTGEEVTKMSPERLARRRANATHHHRHGVGGSVEFIEGKSGEGVLLSYISAKQGKRVYVRVKGASTVEDAKALLRAKILREAKVEQELREAESGPIDREILEVWREDSEGRVRAPGGTEPVGKAKTMRECRARMNSLRNMQHE